MIAIFRSQNLYYQGYTEMRKKLPVQILDRILNSSGFVLSLLSSWRVSTGSRGNGKPVTIYLQIGCRSITIWHIGPLSLFHVW